MGSETGPFAPDVACFLSMVTGIDDRFCPYESVTVVTRWVMRTLGGCLWTMALGVTGILLARSESLGARALALVVLFLLLVTGSLGIRRVVDWAAKGFPSLKTRAVVVLAIVAVIAVIGVLILGTRSALLIIAVFFGVTGTILRDPVLWSRPLVSDKRAHKPKRLQHFHHAFWRFLSPRALARIPLGKSEDSCLGALLLQAQPGIRTGVRSLNRALCNRKRGFGNALQGPTRSLSPPGRPYFRVTEYRDRTQRRVICGEAKVLFHPQQQVASVHFPFWPPFESIPEIHLWRAGKARVKVGKIHPFGMRLDVRLSFPVTNRTRIPVRFRAIERN